MPVLPPLPRGWDKLLEAETTKTYFRDLERFLGAEMAAGEQVLPGQDEVYEALRLTPPEAVRVVLLGQDPYPTPGNAHGLCFSVRPQTRTIPGSLRNIFKELHACGGFRVPNNGFLEPWARQGVLMLNTVLTVRAGAPLSHRGRGWERFTDRVIEAVDALPHRVVFVLWGGHAQKKAKLIRAAHHRIVSAAHPSPLSARLFLGCRCFLEIDRLLREARQAPIQWQIPDV